MINILFTIKTLTLCFYTYVYLKSSISLFFISRYAAVSGKCIMNYDIHHTFHGVIP